ncbi:vascular endothelial growth factor receptor 1-like [Hetaerina americana]|uniref:vascular endothelial growth factor receptor 1-like n=1 Tax=Hetaerina americana TaxID=62018 RepID=UPI003A7F207D
MDRAMCCKLVAWWMILTSVSQNNAIHIIEGNEKIVPSGTNFKLHCDKGNLAAHWVFQESVRSRAKISVSKNIIILEVKNAVSNDTGWYICSSSPRDNPAKIYVYVSDPEYLFVAEDLSVVQATVGENAVIPCRVNNPKAVVTLSQNFQPFPYPAGYNPKEGFYLRDVNISYYGFLACEAHYKNQSDTIHFNLFVHDTSPLPKPYIEGMKVLRFIEGSDVHLICKVKADSHQNYNVNWYLPDMKQITMNRRVSQENLREKKNPFILYKIILNIKSVQKSDQGNYTCVIHSSSRQSETNSDAVQIIVVGKDDSFIKLTTDGGMNKIEVNDGDPYATWAVGYEAVPTPTFEWLAPDGSKIKNSLKYHISINSFQTILNISSISTKDAGVYTLLGKAGKKERMLHLSLVIRAIPEVKISGKTGFFLQSKNYDFKCNVTAYPFAELKWQFFNCTSYAHCEDRGITLLQESIHKVNVTHDFNTMATTSGKLQCQACNVVGCQMESLYLFIADSEEGFSIHGPSVLTEGEDAKFKCIVSIFNFSNHIVWMWKPINSSQYKQLLSNVKDVHIKESQSPISTESALHLLNVTKQHQGEYFCQAKTLVSLGNANPVSSKIVKLVIEEQKAPSFIHPQEEKSYIRYTGNSIELNCEYDGIPEPEIHWKKDGKTIEAEGNQASITFIKRKQILFINNTSIQDKGIYVCQLKNKVGINSRIFELNVTQYKNPLSNGVNGGMIAGIAVVFIILLSLVVYLIHRIRKERRNVNALTAQEVTTFHEGALLTIDPDLGIDEQAELLPYNPDFEFPREKLKFGKQVGSGAFGRVVKAEADGIKDGEKTTTVAVKMVKAHAHISHLKALMTELKILIYIGHHLNVLNILGACTTNLIKKELLVILEYCRYGNLHSYLQRHRESFVNQVHPKTDAVDFTVGLMDNLCEEGVSQNPSGEDLKEFQIAYDNSTGQVQSTDPAGENSMSTLMDSSGSNENLDQRMTIIYKSDFKGKPAYPLCTKDLFCWSYQIAMGMEYLSSLKIVHADLAARNILLADDNIVKISDFGLARNLYKNIDYKKKGQDPLPVKWMAIESIEDRIFSTKSDVWSFGVVLWELFTLGRTPYPGFEVNETFLKRLIQGYRMEKPEYSTHDMYRVMMGCWKDKPFDRPNFTDLVHRIGETLDSETKQHYMELNVPYVNENALLGNCGNNYISMMQKDSSDYISPGSSEKTYVNLCPAERLAMENIKTIPEENCEEDNMQEDGHYLPMTKSFSESRT